MAQSRKPAKSGKGKSNKSTRPKDARGSEAARSRATKQVPGKKRISKAGSAPGSNWTREDEAQAKRNTEAALSEVTPPECHAPGAPATPESGPEPNGGISVGNSVSGRERQLAAIAPFKWKKGQSGHPDGRPKNTPFTEALKDIAHMEIPARAGATLSKLMGIDLPEGTTFAQASALNVFLVATCTTKEAARAFMEITNRVEGKVPVRITGADGKSPLALQMSPAERQKRIADILSKASTGGKRK